MIWIPPPPPPIKSEADTIEQQKWVDQIKLRKEYVALEDKMDRAVQAVDEELTEMLDFGLDTFDSFDSETPHGDERLEDQLDERQSRNNVKQKEQNVKDRLKKIEQNWKYRIKEIINGAGEVTFSAQSRTMWTLGLIWDTVSYHHIIENAIESIEHWMCSDLKDRVVIHGVAKKTKRNLFVAQSIVSRARLTKLRQAPPRKRPPPPQPLKRPPPPPPPPPKRVIHEGISIDNPAAFEPEMPEGPPNEIIGDLGIGSYYNSGGYDPGLDDPNKGTLTTEQKEENTVVELKKNLLD